MQRFFIRQYFIKFFIITAALFSNSIFCATAQQAAALEIFTGHKSASCLVIYAPAGLMPEILLGQRNYDDHQFTDFGGLVEGAEDAMTTAIRETSEETRGAYTPTLDSIFKLHTLMIRNNTLNYQGNWDTRHTTYVYEIVEKLDPATYSATTHASLEMTVFTWIPLKALLSLTSPNELKTVLGLPGYLLTEFFILLKQPQVHSKLQSFISARLHSAHELQKRTYYEKPSTSTIEMVTNLPWA